MKILVIVVLFIVAAFYIDFPTRTSVVTEKRYASPAGCEDSYEKLSKIDTRGRMILASFEYCKSFSPPDLEYIKLSLQSTALEFDADSNKQLLADFINSGAELPDFFKMASSAIVWAEIEKNKSAEELYIISKQIPEVAMRNNYVAFYRIPYLELASKKGHVQAAKELEVIEKEQIEQIEAIRKTLRNEE